MFEDDPWRKYYFLIRGAYRKKRLSKLWVNFIISYKVGPYQLKVGVKTPLKGGVKNPIYLYL